MAGTKEGKPPARRALVHCFDCDQACCRTAVVEVDAPRSLTEYSDLLFYLYHRDTRVVAVRRGRETRWYIEFDAPCTKLVNDRCAVYEVRPSVCREYDMRYCERNTRHRITVMRTTKEFFDFLRDDGRLRILDRLLATHTVNGALPG